MGLLQKREIAGQNRQLYTLGTEQVILIIGLGNPDKEYEGTRHNIGFAVLDYFAEQNDFPGWVEKKDLKSMLTSASLDQSKVILIKPTTFMNLSGEAVQAVQHFFRIYNPHTVVIHDELDVPFGQIRTRIGGSSAGHNGIKSLITHIGEDFGRVRIGIGSEVSTKAKSEDFVLGKFTKEEQESVPKIIKEASVILTEYIYSSSLTTETRNVL